MDSVIQPLNNLMYNVQFPTLEHLVAWIIVSRVNRSRVQYMYMSRLVSVCIQNSNNFPKLLDTLNVVLLVHVENEDKYMYAGCHSSGSGQERKNNNYYSRSGKSQGILF